jgi:hypothetical protein
MIQEKKIVAEGVPQYNTLRGFNQGGGGGFERGQR